MSDCVLLTSKDLAEQLRIGRDRAYALMHSKTFPSTKISGRYYVSKDALGRWIKSVEYKEIIL